MSESKDAVALLAFRNASAPRFGFRLHSTSYLPAVVLTPLARVLWATPKLIILEPN
ncbi:MAG: hypothetical protein OES26_11665 [Gammaproteobacteria bacterium]|nr:hypothetical protein [Gammaproteobacteria bacterium]